MTTSMVSKAISMYVPDDTGVLDPEMTWSYSQYISRWLALHLH
jgi:hypothetical protein